MSLSSRNYSRACEILLNELENNYIQQFYGEGTYIKIRDITFSPVKKTCLVDCVVVLGETIRDQHFGERYDPTFGLWDNG